MKPSNTTPPSSLAPPSYGSSDEARLKVVKGPHKGSSYKLVAQKITIGRSSENDIALIEDHKCSRKQAVLTLKPNNRYSLKDISKKASLKINTIIKIQAELEDGDMIQCGDTVFSFEHKTADLSPKIHQAGQTVDTASVPSVGSVPAVPSVGSVPAVPSVGSVPAVPSVGSVPSLPSLSTEDNNAPLPELKQDFSVPLASSEEGNKSPSGFLNNFSFPSLGKAKSPKKKKKFTRIVLVAVVLMGGMLFLSDSDQPNNREPDKLRTLMDKEESVKTLAELKEKEQKKRTKQNLISYQQAQSAYVNGIRDYRKGVYGRAIEYFSVCHTLYSQHELCASYLKKAQVKQQQLIQAWMTAGKHYREKRRFVPCMSAFKNVMMAIGDTSNLTYKEAYESFKICQIQHEDRY